MGWLTAQHGGDHEGYVIALITREGASRGSGLYRALCGPNDRAVQPDREPGRLDISVAEPS